LVLPSLVLDEAVARVSRSAYAAILAANAALTKVRLYLEELGPAGLPTDESTRAGDAMRSALTDVFVIAPTDATVAEAALQRELNRRRPTRDGHGARDAAIWLTAVQHHRASGSEGYFLTANTRDFSSDADRRILHEDLRADLVECPRPVHYYTSIEALLEVLAVSATLETSAIQAVLANEGVHTAVASWLAANAPRFALPASQDAPAVLGDAYVASPVRLQVGALESHQSWQIGDTTLVATWAEWQCDFSVGRLRRFPGGGMAAEREEMSVTGDLQTWVRQHPTDGVRAQVLRDRRVRASRVDGP
jgi:hypothetical protein